MLRPNTDLPDATHDPPDQVWHACRKDTAAAEWFGPKRLAHWLDDFGTYRVLDLLLVALVNVDDVRRTGCALELRRPLLPLGVEVGFQRVPVDLVDAQHDLPFLRALGHGHVDGLR